MAHNEKIPTQHSATASRLTSKPVGKSSRKMRGTQAQRLKTSFRQHQLEPDLTPVSCDPNLTIESAAIQNLFLPTATLLSSVILKSVNEIELKPFDKVGEKWKDMRLTKLQIQQWNREFIEIEFE